MYNYPCYKTILCFTKITGEPKFVPRKIILTAENNKKVKNKEILDKINSRNCEIETLLDENSFVPYCYRNSYSVNRTYAVDVKSCI